MTQDDSVSHAARRVSGLVGFVDSDARPSGSLPATLDSVLQRHGQPNEDIWASPWQYTKSGRSFEIRSAGADRRIGTADDIVARGQLGRSLPCDFRVGDKVIDYTHLVSPCPEDHLAIVLPMCPALMQYRPAEVPRGSSADTIAAAGLRLVRFARAIEGAGRELGALPPTLRSVRSHPRMPEGWNLADIWGRGVRYEPRGVSYELRSAGRDGVFDNGDDLVISGRLGDVPQCEYRVGLVRHVCDLPTPSC